MKNPKVIINEIKGLLDELADSCGVKLSSIKVASKTSKSTSYPKGALGAINMLIDENFFDSPKGISTVMEKLTEIGHYHKRNAIAMNLLNLTRRRILNRFKNKEAQNWEYVVRK